jgi:two-component system, OmpR family, aerobic respiration control sensor histidine kinase ArcB
MDDKEQELLALKNENATLKKILTLMPGNVYWKDREGKYQGCNQNTADLLKLNSPEDIIGKTLLELDDAKHAASVHHYDEQLMANNKQDIQEEHTCNSAGVPVIYLSHKTPLHDEQGNVIGLVGVSIDITEQRKIEEELKKLLEEAKDKEIYSLKKVVSLMPGNIYWMDKNCRYLGCNDNVANVLNLNSCDDIVGKSNADLIDSKSADDLNKVNQVVMSTGQELNVEEIGFDSNNNPAIYLTRKVPLRDDNDQIIGVAGISFDITKRKKMEEELRAAKEKAEEALRAKEIAEAESREKSKLLKNILEELKEERYYLSGEYQGVHLTQREAQCLVCLAHGHSIKQIGKKLDLSPRTVEVYLNRVKIKLKCTTKTELIAKAIECRFLEGIRPVIPNT